MRQAELTYFINERLAIHEKRRNGHDRPWTTDPILHAYRFTNVFREWDRVTIFVRDWLAYHYNADTVVAGAALARYINNTDTLVYLGFPREWNAAFVLSGLKNYRAKGYRVFNPAYIVSTNGKAMDKLDYVVSVLDEIHNAVHLEDCAYLWMAERELTKVDGVGHFMAGQIIADLKHTPLLKDAKDWWDWATPGPGSMKGLNYALGRPVDGKWAPSKFLPAMQELMHEVVPHLRLNGLRLDAQNFQNCLCEFSKYCRTKDGTGKPKQNYSPTVLKRAH